MRAMLPSRMAGLVDVVRALRRARRVGLRTRTYADARFNTQTPHTVVPVTTPDGVALRVHAYGPESADVIVFAHGWSCCIEYWNPQINAFSEDYRVVAYDQRGHGESELGNRPLSADLLADDLSAVLDAVLRPGQRAVLVGHSMGGITIQAWAGRSGGRRVAERAAAVVLTNTAPGDLIAETTLIPLLRRLPVPLLKPIGRVVVSSPAPCPPLAPVRWVFRHRVMTPATTGDAADFAFAIVRACSPWVRARFGVLLAGLDLGRAAAELTVPTTVIAGSDDDLTPVVHAERIAEMLTEVGALERLTVLPTGHLGNVEAVEAFNAALSGVLTSAFTAREATA